MKLIIFKILQVNSNATLSSLRQTSNAQVCLPYRGSANCVDYSASNNNNNNNNKNDDAVAGCDNKETDTAQIPYIDSDHENYNKNDEYDSTDGQNSLPPITVFSHLQTG